MEQISSKKSDWVKLTGHFFLSELVKNCLKLLGSGGGNDRKVGPIKKPFRKARLEKKRLTDLRLIDGGQNCSTGFSARRCKWFCKWLSHTMQVGCKWLASGLICCHLQTICLQNIMFLFLESPSFDFSSHCHIWFLTVS